MKRIESPTGCVHVVASGNERGGWVTACNHRDYNRWDGYEHQWPLTSKKLSCKRCMAVIIHEQGPCYTEEVMYQWPANQICHGCAHATKFLNWAVNEDVIMCDIKCKLNDGHTCSEFKSESVVGMKG
jgi:hypothetical protein